VSIGSRIIQIRNQKGLTQRELGLRSGIASSYLSRIENRRLEPRPKTLRRIADALQVPISDLFQEGGSAQLSAQCVITSSGRCIMELLRSRRGKLVPVHYENYSPRQVQLLRMANYLIVTGEARVLDALDTVLGAMLAASGKRARSGLVTPLSEHKPGVAQGREGEPG